jgi:hypothetical protein
MSSYLGPVKLRPDARRLGLVFPVTFLLSGLFFLPIPCLSSDQTSFEISPGPRSITAEERALAPDPASGSQQGIILVAETDQNDSAGTDILVWHHIRAKIFTNEGRGLADVEIPFSTGGLLKKWWGFTVRPDGSVQELRREDLQEQEVARSGGEKVSALKGALPGVVPGCVIDYGYLLWQKGIYYSLRVELQNEWPVRSFNYRWVPWGGRTASFRVARATGLGVSVTHDSRSMRVAGSNLPPVAEEPWMPPRKEVGASVSLYYRTNSEKPEDYWNLEAKREARRAQDFSKEKPIKEALASIPFPPGADLFARLKTVHAWITSNIHHSGFRTSEEAEAASDDGTSPVGAKEVLANRKASGRQLEYLFLGFARALGAEADMVLATDRRDHFFDTQLLTTEQFDWSLVAVRNPGEGDDKAVFVDTGSGLPFGELPWWLTGTNALLATPKGARTVLLHPSDPKKNRSDTQVALSFNESEGTATVRWSRTDSGQSGLTQRLDLRGMGPEDRHKRLEELCGETGEFEISRAEAPGLQDLASGLKLECEGTLMNTNLNPAHGGYRFSLDDFWNEAVPEFTAPVRVQPVVFEFPHLDVTVLDVRTPEGFSTVAPEPPAPVESPYGKFAIFITSQPEGYHVERVFALGAIAVPAAEYEPLRQFLAKVHQADRTFLEFRKSGTP